MQFVLIHLNDLVKDSVKTFSDNFLYNLQKNIYFDMKSVLRVFM